MQTRALSLTVLIAVMSSAAPSFSQITIDPTQPWPSTSCPPRCGPAGGSAPDLEARRPFNPLTNGQGAPPIPLAPSAVANPATYCLVNGRQLFVVQGQRPGTYCNVSGQASGAGIVVEAGQFCATAAGRFGPGPTNILGAPCTVRPNGATGTPDHLDGVVTQ
jgi:hypothetical protein